MQKERNKYDDAYVIGYYAGYHIGAYNNDYNKDKQPQYFVKYKSGFMDGKVMKVREQGRA
jgi:hypothetical protein